jgi:Rad3-related DNA helicase
LDTDEKINQLMEGLDKRGQLEAPLLVKLKACIQDIRRSMDSLPDVEQTLRQTFQVPPTSATKVDENLRFRKKLLEFEEKVCSIVLQVSIYF